jgi:cholesterol oxidase
MIYDYIVIGSGFGSSVASLRLEEKGFSVLLLEQGKRFDPDEFCKNNSWKKFGDWKNTLGPFYDTTSFMPGS